MNLDELRSVQSKERRTDSLQHLRESFYSDVSAYISELEAERNRRASEVENPFSDPEVRRLTDEVEAARKVVEAIYDRRLGKIVKQASMAAAESDVPVDVDGLTAEEGDLHDDLVELIEANKTQVLAVLDADLERDEVAAEEAVAVTAPDKAAQAGEAVAAAGQGTAGDRGSAAEPSTTDHETAPDGEVPTDDPTPDAEDGDGSGESPSDLPVPYESDASGLEGRTTVRITGDVDEFFGVDQREYDLEPETVVTLPAENARPLLESGDAELVE